VSRSPVVRITAALLGGLAAAAALLGVLLVASGEAGASGFAVVGLGWLVPLVAGLIVGALSWLLLNDRAEDDPRQLGERTLCALCGSPVLEDWRLCPYCGSFLKDGDAPHEATAVGSDL